VHIMHLVAEIHPGPLGDGLHSHLLRGLQGSPKSLAVYRGKGCGKKEGRGSEQAMESGEDVLLAPFNKILDPTLLQYSQS